MDERLRWLEVRINSSLKPRNEELKNMFLNDENRLAFHEFINNEDTKRLFVYAKAKKQLIASLQPPTDLQTKSVFFLKAEGAKLTKDNIGEEVSYVDCGESPIEHLDLLTREVYLPLLCSDQQHATSYNVSADKLMDVLHRLMASVEVTNGLSTGEIVLPLPSIEVLAEAAATPTRRGAVLHVLESTVIGWIKQIRAVLKHDPIADLERYHGDQPGPLDEIDMWTRRANTLQSIDRQLESAVAKDILMNLEEANSSYAHSFQHVRKEIEKGSKETGEVLKFLSTLHPWFQQIHSALDQKVLLKLFPPVMHTILLVWQYSRYYHQELNFHNLLRVISNEVVHRAMAMVGEDVLREPLESYSKLKEALKVCAAFRGTYLDYRDKADEINTQNVEENKEKMIKRPQGQMWTTKMYGPHAYMPKYGLRKDSMDEATDLLADNELYNDSPWPPRNAPCFDLLNSFMERCNDVLELVQTTRHFRLLAGAAEVGGAGSAGLDALVKEVHYTYTLAMKDFFAVVDNVLSIDGSQAFEKAFFIFRTVVKDLEKKLAEILRTAFQQCPTIGAQLRLLEVFEGISGRELVQANLKDKDRMLVESFTEELTRVRHMFQMNVRKPPVHKNMPSVVSKLSWVRALKARVQGPMEKIRQISPHSLEGDLGWHMRDVYSEVEHDLNKYENLIVDEWKKNVTAELTARLKQPLLVAEEYDEELIARPQVVHVNLDMKLLLLLREIHYLSQEPYSIDLPRSARELVRNTNSHDLRVTATRLETIVSKYNTIMKTVTEFEQPLFDRKLAKIDDLFDQGLNTYTWKTSESVDFIEMATSLVCLDVHQNLDIVQTNCSDIAQITISWSKNTLDVFSARETTNSYSMEELVKMQKELNEDFVNQVVPSGYKIHNLLKSSFEAVQISQASPAWANYVDYIDAIVLDGLKNSTLTSLRCMLNQIIQSNMKQGDTVPILTIRLELIENFVAFRPPLDESTSVLSVQEMVKQWLDSFLARGTLISMLGPKCGLPKDCLSRPASPEAMRALLMGSYKDYIETDQEVTQMLQQITDVVNENGEECKTLLDLFSDYSFLWMQDVNQTFQQFLSGDMSPNPMRVPSQSKPGTLRMLASARSMATSSMYKPLSDRGSGQHSAQEILTQMSLGGINLSMCKSLSNKPSCGIGKHPAKSPSKRKKSLNPVHVEWQSFPKPRRNQKKSPGQCRRNLESSVVGESIAEDATKDSLASSEQNMIGDCSEEEAMLEFEKAMRRNEVKGTSALFKMTSSAKSSIEAAGVMGTAEKTFLTPKTNQMELNAIPTLDEFDEEINIYKTARDEISSIPEFRDVGWLRVDMKPIKQVLTTYASKWMWTFTKYLSDQVTSMLTDLDEFLKRIEPEIESITGEERDTVSFMKMMRLFNEVSAKQNEMDGKFTAMHRTVLLLKKYGQALPDSTQTLFNAAPGRWSNLKTKVSLAKQRLGPRIQEESKRITKDLEAFGERVHEVNNRLSGSDVFNRECSIGDAWSSIDEFVKQLTVLENEAQDLIELQELLETSVVNFSILPQCHHDLDNLKEVWETVRLIDEQQSEWKRHRWQKMNTRFLREETGKQLEVVEGLVEDVHLWDVYLGLKESITTIQACLPLIDDLSNPAMRTRHWKQLVRVTGGALQIDNDTLKRMTLGELLGLGLQRHVDDVRAIVQRAVKDLTIEKSLKTYEEVWLSKVFELRPHVRNKQISQELVSTHGDQPLDSQSERSPSEMSSHPPLTSRTNPLTSRVSNHSVHSRNRRSSISSLPQSLINAGEEVSDLYLLKNTDPIFEELEHHQIALQAMQASSAAGSFLDEVVKWQKRLQTIEAVMSTWLNVQEKWVELEEVYSGADVRHTLSSDANMFANTNRDFRMLMQATEKNPNVLQCCSRKHILAILEKMDINLSHCRRTLLNHLERRRQKFPRFYFLSIEDVLHIVCNGYDLNQVNLYISKLFENVGRIVFDEVEDNDKYNFEITAVQSFMGERLLFKQPVPCEGNIETWLNHFIQAIKSGLQYQLALAMGLEKPPPPKVREIRSAGSRKVVMQKTSGRDSNLSKKERSSSRQGSKPGSRQGRHSGTNQQLTSEPAESKSLGNENTGSWTLDHVTEIVYLATLINMTHQVGESLSATDSGDKDAIQTAVAKINASLQQSVLMLKGLEGEKEVRQKKSKSLSDVRSAREAKEKSETLSESASQYGRGSQAASHVGSMYDLNMESKSPIPEESATDGNGSLVEPTTAEPVDTMNLMNSMSIVTSSKAKDEEVIEDDVDESELKLMLFPSQIHKISCVISLLAHQRDLLQRLAQSADNKGLVNSFEWRSQLQYSMDNENLSVTVQCLDAQFDYGYEYLGSSNREVIIPSTERAFLSLTQAVKAHLAGLCMGLPGSGKLSTVHELSRCVGRALYTFNCTSSYDHVLLSDVFKGLAATGSWVAFNNIRHMTDSVLSVLAHLLSRLLDAMREGKATVNYESEELTLSPVGACFGILDSCIVAPATGPERLLLFNSAATSIPPVVLKQFRVVSVAKPDLKLMVEVLLLSQGFTNATELAHKTNLLYDVCRKLLSTTTVIKEEMKLGAECNEGQHGWSVQTMKYVSYEAGALLDQLVCKAVEVKENVLDDEPSEKHEVEDQEKVNGRKYLPKPEEMKTMEDQAMVTALRNAFMPRLLDKEGTIFSTLLDDFWPDTDVPMNFGGAPPQTDVLIDSRALSKLTGKSMSAVKGHSQNRDHSSLHPTSFRESLHLTLNTPVVRLQGGAAGKYTAYIDDGDKQPIEDINDAIAVATSELNLMPGSSFQSRVAQLSHLNTSHQTIVVCGPSGCGKSECIKTFAVAERERGKTINIQSIFTKAVETRELLGYTDPQTKEWKDGVFPSMLRKFCVQPSNQTNDLVAKAEMKVILLDGKFDPVQLELMESILHNDGSVILANNERLLVADTMRFIWELDSLDHISPFILTNVGLLAMTHQDANWRLMLTHWLNNQPDDIREVLQSFCEVYVEKALHYLMQCTRPPIAGEHQGAKTMPHYQRLISHSPENMITTFCNLMDALTGHLDNLSDVQLERYFNYACIWSFAGTLDSEYRDHFSSWWKQEFEKYVDYPENGTVFDFMVEGENHTFAHWKNYVSPYNGTPHAGIPTNAFVFTVEYQQVYHILSLLSDAGKPIMLVGEHGCGKSLLTMERIQAVCGGEVAEVLSLVVNCNKFTNARLLYNRMDEKLEWKHGRTYVPKGNKKLMCLIDDLNLAQVDKNGDQTAVELVRQHLDEGGFYDVDSFSWRYVRNVSYVSTVNPTNSGSTPRLSQRLLRHFALFGVPYPQASELQTIFSTLLQTHFITPEMTSTVNISAPAAQHLGIHDEKVKAIQLLHPSSRGLAVAMRSSDQCESEWIKMRKVHNVIKDEEELLKKLIKLVVCVNIELQTRMRGMFLPTAQRCHYIFTMKDLGTIFRNLTLSLRPGCSRTNFLLLWQHECNWVYNKRMVSSVDRDRYDTAFATAVRKDFTDDEQINLLINIDKPVFSNLMEQDSGAVTAGYSSISRISDTITEEDLKTDGFRSGVSWDDLKVLMERGVEEYNKNHPRIKLHLYRMVIEKVCRLARIIASPHEVAHCHLVGDGSPGRCTILAQLAAHLCGHSVFKINPVSTVGTTEDRMEQFKADLVAGYTRAGVRSEKLLLILSEEELLEENFLVFITEFVVNGAISHLFSYEETTTIINSIRTEVTQAGLTYTREVAWDFFLKTVRNNFRVCLISTGGGASFQRRCREFSQLTKNVNFFWFSHWSRTKLVEHAAYQLSGLQWMPGIHRENISHMLASMHLVIRQQDGQEQGVGDYSHLTNTTYEKFVERFITLANRQYHGVVSSHNMVTSALSQIKEEDRRVDKLQKSLNHECVVLEERKAGTVKILSQIGQDTAITEQQVKIVKQQMDKIQRLKKLLPEYQVAHERAVFKAIGIVGNTKKIVKEMNIESLGELRAMQKPNIDIEDLMAAIIMILKNPSADLTWQKGAKRQMANLERFIEELQSFDENVLPEPTLNLVEPYLKKPSFEGEAMLKKTNNAACQSLCDWVKGVVRYNRMMISKVKPLHTKVEKTTHAVDNAENKMATLENKRKALEVRLADLARGFEEATIDKNNQDEKTRNMSKMLELADRLRRVLSREHARCDQIFHSLPRREMAVPGSCAIAAGFVSYLGPYHYNFRRVMLSFHWPKCLKERGIPLVIDTIDDIKGRIILFSMEGLRRPGGMVANDYEQNYDSDDDDAEFENETLILEQEGASRALSQVISEAREEDYGEKEEGEKQEGMDEGGEEKIAHETHETENMEKDTLEAKKRESGEKEEEVGESGSKEVGESGSKEVGESGSKEDVVGQSREKMKSGSESGSKSKLSKSESEAESEAKVKTGSENEGSKSSKVSSRSEEKVKSQAESKESKSSVESSEHSDGKTKKEKGAVDSEESDSSGDNINQNAFPAGQRPTNNALSVVEERSEPYEMEEVAIDATSVQSMETIPMLTTSEYNKYVKSLVMVLVGQKTYNEWLKKDFALRQMENAAIIATSWQRPPLLIDPYGEGITQLKWLNKHLFDKKTVVVDMEFRLEPQVLVHIERGIIKGRHVLLKNCEEKLDSMIKPLIHHCNTSKENIQEEEPRMIFFAGRRVLCHPQFCLHLSSSLLKPNYNAVVASTSSIVNYGYSNETLSDDLLMRAFQRLRPELYHERKLALHSIHAQKKVLNDIMEYARQEVYQRVLSTPEHAIWKESDVSLIFDGVTRKFQTPTYLIRLRDSDVIESSSMEEKILEDLNPAIHIGLKCFSNVKKIYQQLKDTKAILKALNQLKEELLPIARRGAMLYNIVTSLAAIQREYQFSLFSFRKYFDEAVGEDFPDGASEDSESDHEFNDGDSEHDVMGTVNNAPSSRASTHHSDAAGRRTTEADVEAGTDADAATDAEGEDYPADFDSDTKDTSAESSPKKQPSEELKDGGSDTGLSTVREDVAEAEEGTQADDATQQEDPEPAEGEEDTHLPIDIPEAPVFPSEGVEYTSLSVNQIKQTVDTLTANFFEKVYLRLHEEHRLLFAALVCLNIQQEAGDRFTEEEMQLILQGNPGLGMQLTLDDFECESPVPDWIPADKWDDILALSVLPGPLDNLCVHIADHPDDWLQWYKSDVPEMENPPLPDGVDLATNAGVDTETAADDGIDNQTQTQTDGVLFSDFHHLLLVRMMRPDRFPIALSQYVCRHMELIPARNRRPTFADVVNIIGDHHLGLLVLTPPNPTSRNRQTASEIKMSVHPTEILFKVAKAMDIAVEYISLSDGCLKYLEVVLADVEKKDCWLIVDNLHLAPDSVLKRLKGMLHRLKLNRDVDGPPDSSPKSCVWVISEPSDRIPSSLIQSLSKMAWDQVSMALVEEQTDEPEWSLDFRNIQPALNNAIVSSLASVSSGQWDVVSGQSATIKLAVYSVCVVQGILQTRQMFGTRGASQWYPYSHAQIDQAIQLLCGGLLADTKDGEPTIEAICKAVSNLIFTNVLMCDWDVSYMTGLVEHVITSIMNTQADSVLMNGIALPTPPANIEPCDYASWYREKTQDTTYTVDALSLDVSDEKMYNEASALQFMSQLSRLYIAYNSDEPVTKSSTSSVHLNQLRTALDLCQEMLPPLLELGDMPVDAKILEFSFPYHRPSVLSLASAENILMPETLGFVLLQECRWLNSLLCHVRQSVYDVQQCLLSGPDSFEPRLLPTVHALQEEIIPSSWIHPNRQPNTHTLITWLEDMKNRRSQLHEWVKRGMVPQFFDGVASNVISRGRLRSVWLGGLVNPQALFMSIRQEKAVVSHCLLDEVVLACEVCAGEDMERERSDDDPGFFVTGLYLQGASWDSQSQSLMEASAAHHPMPPVYVTAVAKSELENNNSALVADQQESTNNSADNKTTEAKNDGSEEPVFTYNCPVFVNKGRQMSFMNVPLTSREPIERWSMGGTALIVDPGCPEDCCKKSRAIVPIRASQLKPPDTGFLQFRFTRQSGVDGAASRTSQRLASRQSPGSQLSYRPMSPKAPPLPPSLAMAREPPMLPAEDLVEPQSSHQRLASKSSAEVAGTKRDDEEGEKEEDAEVKSSAPQNVASKSKSSTAVSPEEETEGKDTKVDVSDAKSPQDEKEEMKDEQTIGDKTEEESEEEDAGGVSPEKRDEEGETEKTSGGAEQVGEEQDKSDETPDGEEEGGEDPKIAKAEDSSEETEEEPAKTGESEKKVSAESHPTSADETSKEDVTTGQTVEAGKEDESGSENED